MKSFDFPSDSVSLGDQKDTRARGRGHQIPPAILKQFSSQACLNLYHRMKLCLQVAVTCEPPRSTTTNQLVRHKRISPLSPNGAHEVSSLVFCFLFDNGVLLQLVHSLGNTKPDEPRQVENALWRAILRVSSGSSAAKEIRMFVHRSSPRRDCFG
jgi:hypothetical protein